MKYFLKGIILTAAIAISLTANAQLNYKKGYIITHADDTIHGKINDGGGKRNSRICLFKEKNNKKAVKYYPKDIKAYRMEGDKYYASKQIDLKDHTLDVFLEVLIKGKVSLYYGLQGKGNSYYMEKDNKFTSLSNEEVIVQYDPYGNVSFEYGTKYLVQNHLYKDSLRSMFKDSKDIHDQVEFVGYNKKSLTKITKAYIAQVCEGRDCINFEKDLKMYKPTMGVFAGVRMNQLSFMPNAYSFFKFSGYDETFQSIPLGVFVNVPLHMFSDKFSLQAEFMYDHFKHIQKSFNSKFNYGDPIDISYQTLGVPVLLKYDIKKGRFTPTVAFGKEFSYVIGSEVTRSEITDLKIHQTQKQGWFGEIGLDYKLAKRVSLFSNLRFQSCENLIIKREKEVTSFKVLVEKKEYYKYYRNNFATLFVGIEF